MGQHSKLPDFAQLIAMAKTHQRRWLVPALIVAVLGCSYALFRSNSWTASQALIVRAEATSNTEGPGKFRAKEDIKAAQETLLELSKSHGLLKQALLKAGHPSGHGVANWPTTNDVVDLADSIKLTPPKGAEFGTSEVFYVYVTANSRERALKLVTAVSEALARRYQELRDDKAKSMMGELERTAGLALEDLNASTAQLAKLERIAGGDLGELRVLNEATSGDSRLRHKSLELDNELRQTQQAQQSNEALLKLLNEAEHDQVALLATPNRLLESQPALKRLKDGLLDAQLRTAQLSSTMSDRHPMVTAARSAEQKIGGQLHAEIATAKRGLEVDLQMNAQRAETLKQQLAATDTRMAELAGGRAEYANLVAEVKHRTQLLENARKELAEARGSQAAAHTASLLSSLDEAYSDPRPQGPGRLILALGSILIGLVIGFSILVLTVQPADVVVAPSVQPTVTPKSPTPAKPNRRLTLHEALSKVAI